MMHLSSRSWASLGLAVGSCISFILYSFNDSEVVLLLMLWGIVYAVYAHKAEEGDA